MAESKKIMISIPDSLLKEIDDIVFMERGNRSEFIREATRFYIKEIKRIQIMERMREGYLEMAEINMALAEIGLTADNETITLYESRLAECE